MIHETSKASLPFPNEKLDTATRTCRRQSEHTPTPDIREVENGTLLLVLLSFSLRSLLRALLPISFLQVALYSLEMFRRGSLLDVLAVVGQDRELVVRGSGVVA